MNWLYQGYQLASHASCFRELLARIQHHCCVTKQVVPYRRYSYRVEFMLSLSKSVWCDMHIIVQYRIAPLLLLLQVHYYFARSNTTSLEVVSIFSLLLLMWCRTSCNIYIILRFHNRCDAHARISFNIQDFQPIISRQTTLQTSNLHQQFARRDLTWRYASESYAFIFALYLTLSELELAVSLNRPSSAP